MRLVLLAVTLAVIVPSSLSADGPPAHEDPSAVSSGFSAISVLGYFGLIASLMADADFDDVPALLEAIRLANIPDDLRFVIDRYTELLGDLRNELDITDRRLNRAAVFLTRDEQEQARIHIGSVPPSLERAGRLLDDLDVATDSLGRRFGVFGPAAGVALTEAYEQLQALLLELEALQNRYEEILRELVAGLVVSLPVIPPDIRGEVESANPSGSANQPGSRSSIPSAGAGLPGPSRLSSAVSEATGTDDGGVAPPGLGSIIPVRIYKTEISFEILGEGYPGRTVGVSGRVVALEGPDPQAPQLRIALDDQVVESFSAETSFEKQFTIPPATETGQHQLSVSARPQRDYGGSSATLPLQIKQSEPSLRVEAPKWTFWTRSLGFSGEVVSEFGPMVDAVVTAKLRNSEATVETDSQGRFSGSIRLSLTELVLGLQTLRIDVAPAEPWNAHVSTTRSTVVVNVINVGMASFGVIWLIAAFGVLWMRKSRPPAGDPIVAAVLASYQRSRVIFAGTGRASPSTREGLEADVLTTSIALDSLRGRIVSAYHRAAGFLGSSQSVAFQPFFTLRDFMAAIGSRASAAFVELTAIAERALYGPKEPTEDDAHQADVLDAAVHRDQGEAL